jgi:putative ABC transport system ATP-binding protein
MLNITNLYKSFPLRSEPVLGGINLSVISGEFCVIIGSNGSGKSTLFKTILGEYEADEGSIYLDTLCMNKLHLHQRAPYISSVVQNIVKGTVDDMTLLENLVLSYLRGKAPALKFYDHYEQKMYKIIAELGIGLERYLYSPIHLLSGGQRQIIATLMSMISDTKLLLLDEHTSALDPKTQRILMEYTSAKIQELGITTLMITHDFDDAIEYGNRLLMMHHGKIVLDIDGRAKKNLTKSQLLHLFHNIQDNIEN